MRGYFFGDRNAIKKTAPRNLDEARVAGKLEGKKEVEKVYNNYLGETLAPQVKDRLANAELKGRGAATAELSAEFKQWWSVREHQIHRNARAYALYEGSVTQIRREKNAEGAEQEEDALTARIATVMAEQIVVTNHHNEVENSIWRHARNRDSPLYVESGLLEGTSFRKNILPKLEAEMTVAQTRLEAVLREQEQRAQDAADSVERDYAARRCYIFHERTRVRAGVIWGLCSTRPSTAPCHRGVSRRRGSSRARHRGLTGGGACRIL
jgi:hypothetical protein